MSSTDNPHYTDNRITRTAVRSALKLANDVTKLGKHPFASLYCVEVQRRAMGYDDNTTGRGCALRDLLHAAIDALKPDDSPIIATEKRWRAYLIAREHYQAGRPLYQLQEQLGIAHSTYDHEQALMVDRLAAFFREQEQTSLRKNVLIVSVSDDSTSLPRTDWREMRDLPSFQGRNGEIAQLTQWITQDRCRLIAIVGMGGVGKTALLEKLVTTVAGEFTAIIWRSLLNAPPASDILHDFTTFLAGEQTLVVHPQPSKAIAQLVGLLQAQRCLLILDNFESLFEANQSTGRYRTGYEAYGELIRCVGEHTHQSCVILTSREKPQEITRLAGPTAPVRFFPLGGLASEDSQRLLQDRGLYGAQTAWQALVARYAGNPLALLMVADAVNELFAGDIARFVYEESPILGDIRTVLDDQFRRLSLLEQNLMYWLAIAREPIGLDELEQRYIGPVHRHTLVDALHSLRRRSMIDSHIQGFTLQHMVMEYITTRLVEMFCDAIYRGEISCINNYPLLLAHTKDYVRQSQERMLLQPVAHCLLRTLGAPDAIAGQLIALLAPLRAPRRPQPGYTAGNVLNLLRHLEVNISDYDFSSLTIRGAYLQDVTLQGVNCSQAHFVDTRFTGTFDAVASLAYHPSGAFIAIGTASGSLALWHVTEQIYKCIWPGHAHWVLSLAFSPDGSWLVSASEDQTIKIWSLGADVCPPKNVNVLNGHTGRVRSVAFSPSVHGPHTKFSPMLASGSDDGTIKLWRIPTGECLLTLYGHAHRVRSVTFHPAGNLLASGSEDHTIKLWDVNTGECLDTLLGHTSQVNSVVWLPGGETLVSGASDHTLRIWRLQNSRSIHTLHTHSGPVSSLAVQSKGDLFASASDDRTIKLWHLSGHDCRYTLNGHYSDRIRAIAFSPDGKTLASGAEDQTVKVWDTETGRRQNTLMGYMNWVQALAIHPEGNLFASCQQDGLIHFWRIDEDKRHFSLRAHQERINTLTFAPDSATLATGSHDCSIKLWHIEREKNDHVSHCVHVMSMQGHRTRIRHLAFSPDGRLLASGGNGHRMRLWDVQTGQCIRILSGHKHDVMMVAFHPSGRLVASSSYDHTVKVWDVQSGACYQTLEGHTDWVRTIAFSPQGHILASGSDDKLIRFWNIHTGQYSHTLHGHTGRLRSVIFTPDGSLLISASEDQTIRLWNAHSGDCVQTFTQHPVIYSALVCSSTAPILVSGSEEATIHLWNFHTGQSIRTLRTDRPYERMNITDATGLTEVQRSNLEALGAIST